jgi:uncharacterized protein (UPF0276 family)
VPALGCAYRPALVGPLFDALPLVQVWEHIADWYIGGPAGARPGPDRFARFAAATPVTLHCLACSLGSEPDDTTSHYEDAVAALVRAGGLDHVSDHLAFSRVGTITLPHFVPLWRVEEQLDLAAENVERVQSAVGARLLVENPASPFDPGGEMSTAAFLNALCDRTGCGVLLDLENLRVNADNGFVGPDGELHELNLGHVVGIHVAGGTDAQGGDRAFDSHAWPVRQTVLDWLGAVLAEIPQCGWVVLERDGRLEPGEAAEVVCDLRRVRDAMRPAPGGHQSAAGQTVTLTS